MDHHDEEFLRTAAEAKARVPQVEPSQIDQRIATGTVVIDVREAEEHAKSGVPGAVNVSIGTLAEKVASVVPNKDAPVICYCNGGNRGSLAAAQLQELGYTNVSSIAGGLNAYVSIKSEK
jgi:rhodanese-related sulfurtransferase